MKTGEIALFLKGVLTGDADTEITGIASVEAAGPGDLVFIARDAGLPTSSACVIAPFDLEVPQASAVIRVDDAKLAFAKASGLIIEIGSEEPGIAASSDISETASIGKNVHIGPGVSIGPGTKVADDVQILAGAKLGKRVTVGRGSLIRFNVVIEDECCIGEEVLIHSGAVIGAEGFGFVRDEEGYVKFPQIGRVIIGNNVEIGANTCIDRGSLGDTRIGDGTKIDNLVQIAHNVQIGKRVVIAAQTGISGSSVVEDDCVIGGQVGMGDHVRVMAGSVIGSQAGILPGKIVRKGVWWGTPVQPLNDYKRQNAHLKSLGRLREEIRELRKKLS